MFSQQTCDLKTKLQRLVRLSLYGLPIVGILLACTNIWTPYSFWLDEIYSVTTSELSFFSMLRVLLLDVHPPLYQSLLWVWIRLFGDYEPIVRGLSLFCSLAAVIFLYNWSRCLDYWTRWLTVTLYSCSWLFSFYAQEARSYALLLLLSTLLVCWFLNEDGKKKYFLKILVVSILLALTHYFGLILATAVLSWLFFSNVRRPKRLCALLMTGLFMLAWPTIQYFYGALSTQTGGNFWIQSTESQSPFTTFLLAISPVLRTWGDTLYLILTSLSFVLIASLLLYKIKFAHIKQAIFKQASVKQATRESLMIWKLIFCVAWVVIFVTLINHHTPISTDRNYIVLLPVISLIFGFAFGSLGHKFHLITCVVLVTFLFGLLQLNYSYAVLSNKWMPLQNWKAAAHYIVNEGKGHQLYYLKIDQFERMDRIFNKNKIVNYYVRKFSHDNVVLSPIDIRTLTTVSGASLLFIDGAPNTLIEKIQHMPNLNVQETVYPLQYWQKSMAIIRTRPLRGSSE